MKNKTTTHSYNKPFCLLFCLYFPFIQLFNSDLIGVQYPILNVNVCILIVTLLMHIRNSVVSKTHRKFPPQQYFAVVKCNCVHCCRINENVTFPSLTEVVFCSSLLVHTNKLDRSFSPRRSAAKRNTDNRIRRPGLSTRTHRFSK